MELYNDKIYVFSYIIAKTVYTYPVSYTHLVVNNKIRPAASSLAISIRLTQKEDCLLDKTYSTEYQQTTKAQRFEDSPSANAACLNDMTECLSMATKEIVEEISRCV